jgi:hypothetical protein
MLGDIIADSRATSPIRSGFPCGFGFDGLTAAPV